jgi:hypothetical protein
MIPFLFWWSIITALALNTLRIRNESKDASILYRSQQAVLTRLIDRVKLGEVLNDQEIRRELEMVGLRERSRLTVNEAEKLSLVKDVGWVQVLFGRRGKGKRSTEMEMAAGEGTSNSSTAAQVTMAVTEDEQAAKEWAESESCNWGCAQRLHSQS